MPPGPGPALVLFVRRPAKLPFLHQPRMCVDDGAFAGGRGSAYVEISTSGGGFRRAPGSFKILKKYKN